MSTTYVINDQKKLNYNRLKLKIYIYNLTGWKEYFHMPTFTYKIKNKYTILHNLNKLKKYSYSCTRNVSIEISVQNGPTSA